MLRTNLDSKDRTLLLAYTDTSSGILLEDLFSWVEYSNLSMFKKAVIRPLHKAKLIEFDEEAEAIFLSPLGVQEVEMRILTKI